MRARVVLENPLSSLSGIQWSRADIFSQPRGQNPVTNNGQPILRVNILDPQQTGGYFTSIARIVPGFLQKWARITTPGQECPQWLLMSLPVSPLGHSNTDLWTATWQDFEPYFSGHNMNVVHVLWFLWINDLCTTFSACLTATSNTNHFPGGILSLEPACHSNLILTQK